MILNTTESFFVSSACDVATIVIFVLVSSIAINKYPYSSITVLADSAPSTDQLTSLLICVPVTVTFNDRYLPAA